MPAKDAHVLREESSYKTTKSMDSGQPTLKSFVEPSTPDGDVV